MVFDFGLSSSSRWRVYLIYKNHCPSLRYNFIIFYYYRLYGRGRRRSIAEPPTGIRFRGYTDTEGAITILPSGLAVRFFVSLVLFLFFSFQKVSSNHRCSPVKTSSSTPDLNRSKYLLIIVVVQNVYYVSVRNKLIQITGFSNRNVAVVLFKREQ